MRTTLTSLLSLTALALGIAACGGATADFEPNGTDTENTGGAGGGGDETETDGGTPDDASPQEDSGSDDGGDDIEVPPPTIEFACPGGTIAAGSNKITVGSRDRTFLVDLPSDTSKPLGVVFAWHGYGDNANNFRSALGLDPDADPAHPLIVVTPEDSGLQPFQTPRGLDWDILAGKPGDSNIDLAFFEAMLGCLNEQYTLDTSRIYSVGFSAGSVFTALLHSRYPQLFAATAHFSGAWMNDPAEVALINNPVPFLISLDWSWPDLDPADGGHVLLTRGGSDDEVGLENPVKFTLINLEDAAQAALPFLAAANRTVVDCAHDAGHVLHPELTPSMLTKYLTAHRAGAPSPFAGSTLAGLPSSCTLKLP